MTDLERDETELGVTIGHDEVEAEPERHALTTYKLPGPVAKKFIQSRQMVTFLQGPYGSGKTTVCLFKLLLRAMRMPVCKDGVRRYRALVVRDTYRRMERTAIRSWQKWFSKELGTWTGGQDRPSRHIIHFRGLDGAVTEIDIEFAAVGDRDAEDFFDGFEFTDLFLNAVNLQPRENLIYGAGRCGRYPAMKDLPDGADFDAGVIGDLNAPEPDSWLVPLMIGDADEELDELGASIGYFLQPGGRDPNAENIHNLKPGYYAKLAALNASNPWWVARMIDNKVGYSRHGKPVYDVYHDERHCAPAPIPVDPKLPLLVGFDAGLHPAAVFGQPTATGQLRVVAEIVPGWMGPGRFADLVAAWLALNARDMTVAHAWADPSAFGGADQEGGELTWVQTVEKALSLRIQPAPSNEPSIRIDAVAQLLVHSIDGTSPALVVSPAARELRRGFVSTYRFNKVKTAIGEDYALKPAKDSASHVHDALQYLVLGWRGKNAVIDRRLGPGASRPRVASTGAVRTDFDVFKKGPKSGFGPGTRGPR